jgi:hypothetical protein
MPTATKVQSAVKEVITALVVRRIWSDLSKLVIKQL